MKDDKTQLLNEIINLLKPISGLSKHYSRIINDNVEKKNYYLILKSQELLKEK